MKKILLPELSLKYCYCFSISNLGPFEINEIIFAYDGNDYIAWLSVEEIDEANDSAYAVIVGSSYSGE